MNDMLLLGNLQDKQTGLYILESGRPFFDRGTAVDIRKMSIEVEANKVQETILNEISNLKLNPSLIIVMKGLELTTFTLKKIREMFPKAKIVNWFFDIYLGNNRIWEIKGFFEVIKLYDYFFCSLKGVADKLTEEGLDNVRYLDEACSIKYHTCPYFNYFQEKIYGEDISFAGSLGFFKQHPDRIRVLKRVLKEGFKMKVWGNIVCQAKSLPLEIRQVHENKQLINEEHSIMTKVSLINLCIDQDTTIDMGHSARIYRIMCAGGLVLSTATKGLDKMFKVNKKGEEIKPDQNVVLFYNDDDLVKKLDFLLEHDELRNKIAENGMKKVREFHTFEKRMKKLIEVIKNER